MIAKIENPDLIYQSFGSGQQSYALMIMGAEGLYDCPRPDLMVFADTQNEPSWVYDALEIAKEYATSHGIKFVVSTAGNLGQRILDRVAGKINSAPSIPAFTPGIQVKSSKMKMADDLAGQSELFNDIYDDWGLAEYPEPEIIMSYDNKRGMLRRHCTRDYKVRPIERAVKIYLGYGKGTRKPRNSETAWALIGYSVDEISRMRINSTGWIENKHPLIDSKIDRAGCNEITKKAGLAVPGKSSCYFCPYHSDEYWQTMKDKSPADFEKAAAFDDAIRRMDGAGVKADVYLHPSLKPLREVNFKQPMGQRIMFDMFENDCEGMAGSILRRSTIPSFQKNLQH